MFGLPTLYLKLAGAAVIAAVLGWHLFGDWRVKHTLEQTQLELANYKVQYKQLEDQFVQATKDRDSYKKAGEEADAARAKVRADLDVTLKKLRAQKPPTECKAAIDWAVQNRDDLKWEAQ